MVKWYLYRKVMIYREKIMTIGVDPGGRVG
jgi:hypothetical protein